jgi:hypothetical protein
MGQVFQQALRLTKDRQSLLENQRLWLTQRDNSCGALADTAIWSCLLETTKSRAAALTKAISPTVEVPQTIQSPPAIIPPTTSQGRADPPLIEPRSNPSPPTSPNSQKGPSKISAEGDSNLTPVVLLVLLVFSAAIALRIVRNFRRKQRLVAKYGEEIAALIIARKFWQGMTEEQLTDSWGNPTDVGREIIRTRIKETWKYNQTGKNRFSNRVYLENGIVIGWKN